GQKESLKKLIYLTHKSEILQGAFSIRNFKPSLEKFLTIIEDIFDGKYNKKEDTIHSKIFKKMHENEAIVVNDYGYTYYDDINITDKLLNLSKTTELKSVT